MAFQGSLAELHLPDIIQLISVSGKTGVFQLTNGALQGQIYLHDGKIVHASLEDQKGDYRAVPVTGVEHDRVDSENSLGVVFRILTGFPPRYFLRLEPR